jgi:hypothetical protein
LDVHLNTPEHLPEVETDTISQEQVKHYIREAGVEAEFNKAPRR